MPHESLELLLILQDRDMRRLSLEGQLAAIPTEREAVNAKIVAEKAAIEAAKGELNSLESSKKLIETEIGLAEAKLAKYKTQQLSVKKNDEYQALGHEIETMEAAVGRLEEKEIDVLYQIDEARKRFKAAQDQLNQNIATHEAKLKALAERETNLTAELSEARGEVAKAREPVPEKIIRIYDRVAPRHMPACVPVRGGKCSGCHLKISSEAEAGARSKDPTTLGICDQCSRIIWWDY